MSSYCEIDIVKQNAGIYGSNCCYNGSFNDCRMGLPFWQKDVEDELGTSLICKSCGTEICCSSIPYYGFDCEHNDNNNMIHVTGPPELLSKLLAKYYHSEKIHEIIKDLYWSPNDNGIPFNPLNTEKKEIYDTRLILWKRANGLLDNNSDDISAAKDEINAIIRTNKELKQINQIKTNYLKRGDVINDLAKISEYLSKRIVLSKTHGKYLLSYSRIQEHAKELIISPGDMITKFITKMIVGSVLFNETYFIDVNNLIIIITQKFAEKFLQENLSIGASLLNELYAFRDNNKLKFLNDSMDYDNIYDGLPIIMMGIELNIID